MLRKILVLVSIIASSACSHAPTVYHPQAYDANRPGAQPATTTAVAAAASPTTPVTLKNDTFASQDAAPSENDPLIEPLTGYESVAAARKTLAARTDVQAHDNPQGWWIAEIPSEHKIWTFTPLGHPAHPAAVVREAVNEHGVIRIRMAVLCTAEKAACDGLIAEFKPINEEMRKRLQENL